LRNQGKEGDAETGQGSNMKWRDGKVKSECARDCTAVIDQEKRSFISSKANEQKSNRAWESADGKLGQ
jgi:hypothetical protein